MTTDPERARAVALIKMLTPAMQAQFVVTKIRDGLGTRELQDAAVIGLMRRAFAAGMTVIVNNPEAALVPEVVFADWLTNIPEKETKQ